MRARVPKLPDRHETPGCRFIPAAGRPAGTVYRCRCGRLWVIVLLPGATGYRRVWNRAGWRLRWRWRHMPPRAWYTPGQGIGA